MAQVLVYAHMADKHSSTSPLEKAADTVSEQTTEAFEILGNETRLAILLALWEAQDPGPPFSEPSEPALSFSELYDRVDMGDSGNFTYHLDKLVGLFVEDTDEGYTLTPSAERMLHAVLAGTLSDPPSFKGEPIDAGCYRCGSPVVIDYLDRNLHRRCTGCEGIWQNTESPPGLLVAGYRPPVALENRTVQEWNRDCNTRDRHRRASIMEGVCPDCAGTVTTTINVCEAHDTHDETVCEHCGSLWEIQTTFVCDACKFAWNTPAWGPIFTETAVLAFFHEHGLDPRDLFDVSFYSAANRKIFDAIEQVTVRSAEPGALAVRVELDGGRLEVVLDEEARVVDVTEAPS